MVSFHIITTVSLILRDPLLDNFLAIRYAMKFCSVPLAKSGWKVTLNFKYFTLKAVKRNLFFDMSERRKKVILLLKFYRLNWTRWD